MQIEINEPVAQYIESGFWQLRDFLAGIATVECHGFSGRVTCNKWGQLVLTLRGADVGSSVNAPSVARLINYDELKECRYLSDCVYYGYNLARSASDTLLLHNGLERRSDESGRIGPIL